MQQVSVGLVLLLAALFAGDEQLSTKMVSTKYKNFIGQVIDKDLYDDNLFAC